MIGKILYLLYLIVLFAFYILYIDSFAFILLLCSLLLPVFLGFSLFLLKRRGSAELSCNLDICHTGDSIPVTLSVTNQCVLAFSHMQADIAIRHHFGDCEETLCLRFPLHAKNTTKVTFYIHADYSGMLSIRMKKLRVRDYFHLFSMKYPMQQQELELTVMPKYLRLRLTLAGEPVDAPERDTFGDKPGDDPSEIFNLREYQVGDAVNRIHWKLSSRSEQLIYKEFSHPEERRILLLFDASPISSRQISEIGQMNEAVFSLLYSVSANLLSKKVPYRMLWWSKEEGLMAETLSDNSMLIPVFRKFYETLSFSSVDERKLLELLETEYFSSIVCITNDLRPQLLHVIDQCLTANQKTVVHITQKIAPGLTADHTSLITIHPDTSEKVLPQLII